MLYRDRATPTVAHPVVCWGLYASLCMNPLLPPGHDVNSWNSVLKGTKTPAPRRVLALPAVIFLRPHGSPGGEYSRGEYLHLPSNLFSLGPERVGAWVLNELGPGS